MLRRIQRSPMNTSTLGCGQVLQQLLNRKDLTGRTVYITVGGSSTNDLGCGLASALGYQFLDSNGRKIEETTLVGSKLTEVNAIEPPPARIMQKLKDLNLIVWTDVATPLRDCTAMFAPQKGATTSDLPLLQKGIENIAKIIGQSNWCSLDARSLLEMKSGGAAGGLAAGLMAFAGARIEPGFESISSLLNLPNVISNSDLVITGEGKLDATSFVGKVPCRAANLAKLYGTPCIGIAGAVPTDPILLQKLYGEGLTSMFAIASGPLTLKDSKEGAFELIKATTEQVIRTLFALNSIK